LNDDRRLLFGQTVFNQPEHFLRLFRLDHAALGIFLDDVVPSRFRVPYYAVSEIPRLAGAVDNVIGDSSIKIPFNVLDMGRNRIMHEGNEEILENIVCFRAILDVETDDGPDFVAILAKDFRRRPHVPMDSCSIIPADHAIYNTRTWIESQARKMIQG
jgi:hypothetical protein